MFVCLFVFVCVRVPGVFPESPRWLLLSETSGDMNSFSERRERDRDDESFTGQRSPVHTDGAMPFCCDNNTLTH